jgi:hypothetical protein
MATPLRLNRAYLIVSLAALAAGCNSTTVSTTWKDPSAGKFAFKKIIVAVLNSTPGERRAAEDALVAKIKGTQATPSYSLLTDEQLADVDSAKQRVIAAGFDAAVLLHLLDTQQKTTYVPPSTTWDADWNSRTYHTTPGYVVSDTLVRAEIRVYSLPDAKLLWAGAAETVNPESAQQFAQEVADAAAGELKKQGLIQ